LQVEEVGSAGEKRMKSLLVVSKLPAITWPKRLRFALLMPLACLFLLASSAAHGQITNVDDTTSTPIEGAGHDYIKALSETVNPANGSVSLSIQLPIPKGRGITPTFSIVYNSNGVNHFEPGDSPGTAYWASNATNTSGATGGWSVSVPSVTYSDSQMAVQDGSGDDGFPEYEYCEIDANYMFTDLSGSQHALNVGAEIGSYDVCAAPNFNQGGDPQVGAVLTGQTSSAGGAPETTAMPLEVYDANGTVYMFGGGGGLPSLVEDRNGNVLNFTGGAAIGSQITVTDTAGRPVIFSNGIQGSTETLTVGGLSYTIYFTTISTDTTLPSNWVGPSQPGQSACKSKWPAVSLANGHPLTQTAISQIVLPNQTSYSFTYESTYGLLSKITYPSGAWVEYTWKPSDNTNELADYSGYGTQTVSCGGSPCGPPQPTIPVPIPNVCLYQYASPVVATRNVGFTSSPTAAQTQTFSYHTNWDATNLNWTTKTTQVATTAANVSGTSDTNYTYKPISTPANSPFGGGAYGLSVPVEGQIDYYDYNGTHLETVTKNWNDQYRLASSQTIEYTKSGSVTSEVAYNYISNTPNALLSDLQTEEDEYDFGASSPTRRTLTNYQTFTGLPYQAITLPSGSHFTLDRLELPGSVVVCAGGSPGPSCSNVVAETDYSYTTATTSVSGLRTSTHDETNYSASQSTPRGNIGTVTKKCVQGCTSSLVTTYTYDETGQVASMKDPNGNTTSYSFTDNPSGGNQYGNSNAYLTQITYPSANGVAHTENFQYDYTSGYLTEADDENGQPTDYTYVDPLTRPTEVQGPPDPNNGNQRPTTTLAYNDSALTVTSTVTQNPNPSKTSIQSMDGMGHTVQTELTTDPDGTDYVTTTYDGMGRVYTVSNPYRSGSPPVTTYTYDALGRKVIQQNQDGSKEYWCYNGIADNGQPHCVSQINTNIHVNPSACIATSAVPPSAWVDSTDENGNHWQRSSDSFGRLEGVVEDASNSTLQTFYSYDLLNDLCTVNQVGKSGDTARARTFTYDNFSRLLSSTNPETGTLNYTYDADSNLHSKADARGITTTYGYDALNRLISKTYSSNDASKTPVTCFQYDTSSIPGAGGNMVGRLTNEWTAASGSTCPATPPSSSYYTLQSILSYDTMGRITNEQQCTPHNCTSGSGPTVSYGFDLAGNATSLTNSVGESSGPLVLTTVFDGAAHVSSVVSNWNSFPTNLFTANSTNGYMPFGGLENWTHGPSLSVTQGYDPNRLWLNSISATGQIP
jgi:YD repeat-containing protein